MTKATLFFDGGSRGNPGPAAGGAVLTLDDDETFTDSKFLPHATSNEAEYTGLIVGLNLAISKGVSAIAIYGDSNLVVNQVCGRWRCKHPKMDALCKEVQQLLGNFETKTIKWVRRDFNAQADEVVNAALDEATGISNDYLST